MDASDLKYIICYIGKFSEHIIIRTTIVTMYKISYVLFHKLLCSNKLEGQFKSVTFVSVYIMQIMHVLMCKYCAMHVEVITLIRPEANVKDY